MVFEILGSQWYRHCKIVVWECCIDFDSVTRDHSSKVSINNLFMNFKIYHIMANIHIQSWCGWKGIDFSSHPQSMAPKGKSVVPTVADHRVVVVEGIDIQNVVNTEGGSDFTPFVLVGDLDAIELKSFCYKVRCTFCNDLFQLCPPKKNLHANLKNHLEGTKHAKMVETSQDSDIPTTSALSTSPHGIPSTFLKSIHTNQRNFYG